jgi:diguanylate cyclase (GGDEF)-like protein/PAS domain S-box-containing protein
MASGDRVGTLCVIDHERRQLTPAQREALTQLAQLTAQALELRERAILQSLAVRNEHDAAVAASERRFRAILDAQSELVSQSTAEGRLVYVNPAYATFFGTTVDALVGSSLYDHVLPEDREAVRAHISDALAGHAALSGENRMVSPEGEERWVSWTNTRQTADDGSVLLHSTGRDVTARVRAQRAWAHSEALLEKTGRAARVGGWELDIRSNELSWTAETRRIHEMPADFRPTLEQALSFYAPASRQAVEAAVAQALADGSPWDLELQLITGRGRAIWARAIGEVEFEGQLPIRMFGAFQDISERRAAEQSRQQIAAIFDNSPDFIVQADSQRNIRYMNPAAARVLLGRPWAMADADQLPVATLLPEETQRSFQHTILPALQRGGVWVGQSMIFDAGQRVLPASHMEIAHRDEQGSIARYSIIWRDVSELVAAQAERERQARTLRSVTDAIPSSVAVMDRNECYAMVNPAFAQLLGLNADLVVGRPARDVLGADEYEARRPWIERALAGEAVRFERQLSDGAAVRSFAFDYLPLRSADDLIEGFVAIGQDITELRQERDRLQQLSQTDALTQLLNRVGFELQVQQLLSPQADGPLALLYCDLDLFKPVNDTHGHAAGDALLRLVGRQLTRLVRPSDAVARLGGDEFALALPGMYKAADAERVGQAIVDALRQPFQIADGVTVQIGCSVGIALRRAGEVDAAGLLARADRALYEAKRGGRSRYAVAPSSDD